MTLVIAAWYTALVIQAALVWRLRRERSLFQLFLMLDLAAWLAMALIDRAAPQMYIKTYIAVEPSIIALLAAACVEAQASLTHRRPGLLEWMAILSAAGAGALWLESAPLQRLFVARGMISLVMAGALLSTMLWTRAPDLRACILVVFCALDAWAYTALLFGAPKYDATGPLMVGQACCLLAWLVSEFPVESPRRIA